MIRVLNFFCVALMGLSILGLYHVSERTRVAEMQLAKVDRQITDTKSGIGVLQTEWARVAGPARIQELAQRDGMSDTSSVELSSFNLLPHRADAPLNNSSVRNANAGSAVGSAHPHAAADLGPYGISGFMGEKPGIFQRRIVIGAVFCVAAFTLVGIRLVDVTLMRGAWRQRLCRSRRHRPRRSGRPQWRASRPRSAGPGPLCPPPCLLGQGPGGTRSRFSHRY